MKHQRILIAAVVAPLLLTAGSVLISRHRANAKADRIMRPTFTQGWFRGRTHPILWLNGKWQPSWSIQYEMDHPTAIVDFGPQFLISWSGGIIMASPDDLDARIREYTEAVEQAESIVPLEAALSASPEVDEWIQDVSLTHQNPDS